MYDPKLSFRPQGEICFIQETKILPQSAKSALVRMTLPGMIQVCRYRSPDL